MQSRIKKIIFRIVTVMLSILFISIIAEIILRLSNSNIDTNSEYIDHPSGFYYTRTPLSKTVFENEEGQKITSDFDEYGLKNSPNSLGDADIIILGDSFIMAVNTPLEKTFVGILKEKGFKIYNAGVDGFSTFHEFFLLRDLLKYSHPKVVILAFYLGNDFRDNFVQSELYSLNDLQSSTSSKDGSKQDLTFKSKAIKLLQKSALLRWLYDNVYTYFSKSLSIMNNYSLSEIELFRKSLTPDGQKAVLDTKAAIFAIDRILKKNNIKLVIVGIPDRAQTDCSFLEIQNLELVTGWKDHSLDVLRKGYSFDHPDSILHSIANECEIPYISLLKSFRNSKQRLFYQIDSHWNSDGQKIAAECVADTFVELGLKKFKTTIGY